MQAFKVQLPDISLALGGRPTYSCFLLLRQMRRRIRYWRRLQRCLVHLEQRFHCREQQGRSTSRDSKYVRVLPLEGLQHQVQAQ